MQAQTMPRVIAAALFALALVVLLARDPTDELAVTSPATAPPPAEPRVTTARADVEPPPPLLVETPEAPAAEKVRELEAMSETFRNSTFLIAIREAGFVCHNLLRVYGGLDDSGKWTATCSEMLAYTVTVAGDGALRVDPMLQYFDGVLQRINFQQFERSPLPSSRAISDGLPPEAR